jgi:hypothetical protein
LGAPAVEYVFVFKTKGKTIPTNQQNYIWSCFYWVLLLFYKWRQASKQTIPLINCWVFILMLLVAHQKRIYFLFFHHLKLAF